MWTGCDIGKEGILQIQIGVLQGLLNVLAIEDQIEGIVDQVENHTIAGDWQNVWSDGCKSVNMDFFNDILDIIRKHADDARKVILQIFTN